MAETAVVRLVVDIEVAASEDQTSQEATEAITKVIADKLASPLVDGFVQDYAASIEDVDAWLAADPDERDEIALDRSLPSGGYEGPWAVGVQVARSNGEVVARTVGTHSVGTEDVDDSSEAWAAAFVEHAVRIASLAPEALLGTEPNSEYLRGQIELAVAIMGYQDDGSEERLALEDAARRVARRRAGL